MHAIADLQRSTEPLQRSTAGEIDATLWILVGLSLVAGWLVHDFVRHAEGRPVLSMLAALAGHLLLLFVLSQDPSRVSCAVVEGRDEPIEFEVARVAPEKETPPEPEEEKPEPEPQKQDEPEPELTPPKKKVRETEVEEKPVPDDPPPPMRFDLSNTTQGGQSGVVVEVGEPGGAPGGTGTGRGKTSGGRPLDSETGGDAPWEPRSEIFVKTLPDPVKVPKIQCPASVDLGIEGTVVLKVQVRRDGTIRQVHVSRGINKQCDAIAARALRQARFRPAVATNGKTVDYELRYEYEFRLTD